jgi:O-succinylbenzoic acid--CoA ligase
MKDWLAQRVQATPQATALIIDKRTWSYHELDRLVDQSCAKLSRAGIVRDQMVAALLPNNLDYVCLVHALARLGAVLAPLNTRLTWEELAWQLDKIRAPHLVTQRAMADAAQALAAPHRQILELDIEEKTSAEVASEESRGSFDPEGTQAIVFTSGTTGRPKGARLTYNNHFWSATASSYRLGIEPGDRWLSCLPLYHVGGLAVLFRSCLYGTAVVLHDGFDVERFSHSLAHDGVTLTSLVPTMLYRLLAAQPQGLEAPTLRVLLLGGAAAPTELIETCLQQGLPVAPTYGLTEASSQVATLHPADLARKPGSVGSALMFTSVKVIDDSGAQLPEQEIGEIIVRGPTVMSGYFEEPEATAATLDDGWLHSGDVGYLDEDGDLWLVQRRSDIILSGGENVYPAEVESVLRRHPDVEDACVVGVPDPEWGQVVTALVQTARPEPVGVDALLAFCRRNLAGYKQPRRIRFTDRLPQTASGKIARAVVAKEMALSGNEPGEMSAQSDVH